MNDSLHHIRVRDLRVPLASDSGINIEATVLFENLETRMQKVLQDTVVEFSGKYTHNYILKEKLEIRNPYKITVSRPDGNFVSSVATTPGITSVSVTPSENIDCHQSMFIRFENVLSSEQIRLEVRIQGQDEIRWSELTRICPLTKVEDENAVTLIVSPLEVIGAVFPRPETNVLSCNAGNADIHCRDLDSNIFRFDYLHLGPEWQRVYPLYPVDPEDIEDINNGLGFFGAYRDGTFNITVNTDE